MEMSGLLLFLALATLGHCQTIVQQVCTTNTQSTSLEQGAGLMIGGLFEIRGMGTNGSGCGKPLSDTMQIFEAARFAVNVLNSGAGYITGVKFGMDAYDTCLSYSNVLNVLQKLYPQTTTSNPYCASSNRVIAGVVGTLSSMTTVPAAALAGQLPISIISPGATAPELSDKVKFPTFLRTVPSYVVFAKVVVELLQQLQWQNVMVIYTDEPYGRSGYEQLLEAMYARGLCVTRALSVDMQGNKESYKAALSTIGTMTSPIAVLMAPNSLAKVILQAVDETPSLTSMQWVLGDIDITNDASSIKRLPGAMVVVPRSPLVVEFRQYFTQLQSNPGSNNGNPWFKDWFETTYGCSLASGNCPTPTEAQFMQSPWAVPTMKAVFAYAEAVRSICPNSLVCPTFTSMTPTAFNNVLFGLNFIIPASFPSALVGQKIKFNANGDPGTSEFTIYNYNNQSGSFSFKEIGRYESNVLTLDTPPSLYDSTRSTLLTPNPTATCAALGCGNCVTPRRPITFRYKPGDLVIASLVNAHDSGSAPFICGAGRVPQLAALVAAEWAVSQYKASNRTKLQQVTLGSLVADICPGTAVAQGFLTDLLSGNDRLKDSSGAIIPYKNIQAFVDQTSSDQTQGISPIISNYSIPEVATSVTTSIVFHGGNTPYFTRTVPSDKVLYSSISSLLQRLGWKYVQVATHKSGEYREMAETFKQVAAGYGICVVDTVSYFGDGTADSATRAAAYLSSNLESQIVVVFASMMNVRGLLTAIGQGGASSQLQLIAGTDTWATNPAYTQGLETSATGAIVVDLELSSNAAFNTYLQSLSLAEIAANPFLRELFELTNQCVIDSNSRRLYARTCASTDTLNNIYLDKVPFVIQSINTVADKLHELISEVCSASYSGLCSAFHSTPNVGSRLSVKLADIPKAGGFGTKNGESTTDVLFYVYNQGWKKFGQYNTESQTLVSADTTSLVSYSSRLSTCTGVCMACQYLFKMQPRVYHPGDWIIAGAFGVSNSGPEKLQPYICGNVRTINGPQFTLAMMYALQQVNSGKAPVSVKGVTFGDLILDHCTNPDRANLMVSDVYAGSNDPMDMDNGKILAWITDTSESTNETIQILDPLSVVTVSPSATSDGLMKYPTFFRTIQGDGAVVKALILIVKALKLKYIQVIYSSSTYGREGLNLLTTASQTEGICIINQVEFSAAMNVTNTVTQLVNADTKVVILFTNEADTGVLLPAIASNPAAGSTLMVLMPKHYPKIIQQVGGSFTYPIISLQLQKLSLPDYDAYINSSPISNPFFAQYYMKLKGCNVAGGFSSFSTACASPLLPITSDSNYDLDEYVLSTIDAVYAVVDALHRTVSEYCGSNYTTPCSNFLAASDKRQRFNYNLNSVSFVDDSKSSFKFLFREGASAYNILQSNTTGRSNQVGSFSGQSLNFNDAAILAYRNVISACSSTCPSCITNLDFSFTPGDIYIAGIFDVHQRFVNPFTCGAIKTLHGFLMLEAFHYALDQVNAKGGQFAGILRGTRLGGVGLDACESTVRGGYIISNIHSGLFTLAKDSTTISPSKIDAYIGSYTSPGSTYIARILTDLEISQISYGAGSQDLSDHRVYPYFYRTVPTDKDQVEAMLKLMDKLNIRYVQVLYEDNSNGISSMNKFVEGATNYSICVAAKVAYPDIGVNNFEVSTNIVTQLADNPTANTIVTFLSTKYINSVLVAMGTLDKARNKFRFVGSDSWADNQDAINGVAEQAVNSFTVGLDADDVENFESYINSKNVANSKYNPWFAEYFQKILTCYLSKADTMGYPIPCPSSQVSLINSPLYQQESDVVYVINAVYAAAFSIHKTLMDVCGVNYTTACQAYYSLSSRRTQIRDNLANVSFTDPMGRNFMFVDRSGVASYRFFSINAGSLGYTYAQIGIYNMSTEVVSLNSDITTTNSDCNRPDACAECPAIRNSGLRYVFHKSTMNMNRTVVAFFDVHKQGSDPYRCGDINVAGFQQLLAFFYAVENLFTSANVNNYRILAIDTCSNSMRVDQDLFGLLEGTGLCNSEYNNANPVSMKNIGGVITLGELNTVAASRVLELPGITYVSPNALSTFLDDKQHLLRTIAPVSARMKALVTLLSKLGWSYVDVVYEDSPEGINPYRSFAPYAYSAGIKGGIQLVVAGSRDSDVQSLLGNLNGATGSRVIILLGSYNFIQLVLGAASAMSIADSYVWVLGGELDMMSSSLGSLLPVGVEFRFVTMKSLQYMVGSFDGYVNGLQYSQVHSASSGISVPQEWFDEYYQLMFDCTLSTAAKPINIGKAMCDTSRQFSNLTNWTQDMYTLNTIAATYALVYALNTCGDACSVPMDTSTARANILRSVLNVQLQWPDSLQTMPVKPPVLQFDKANRWWDYGYVVRHLRVKKLPDGSVDVKDDQLLSGSVNATSDEISQMKSILDITSVCNRNASFCTDDGIETPQPRISEPFNPKEPRNYYYYHANGDQQYDWPIWAIIVAIITSVGLLVAVILFLILIFAYPIRGGTSILGFMIIIGIIGIYAINFAFFVNAKDATCGARRFLMGVVYMIALAPLLIKAIDNWRFGYYSDEKQRYRGISSTPVLLLAAVAIVLIQCIIPIIWLILVHPTASQPGLLPITRHDNWWCDPPELYDTGLVQSFIFVMFILLVTAIFSVMTFDSERNNFESRWILLSCIATASCFLVWMIVSTSAVPSVRDPAVAIGNLINATLLLLALPLRKSILLCRHLRNKDKDEDSSEVLNNGNGHLGAYNDDYDNPGLHLNIYDNYGTKPSEY